MLQLQRTQCVGALCLQRRVLRCARIKVRLQSRSHVFVSLGALPLARQLRREGIELDALLLQLRLNLHALVLRRLPGAHLLSEPRLQLLDASHQLT